MSQCCWKGRFGCSVVERRGQVLYFDPERGRGGRERVHIESHILIVDDDLQIRKLLGRYLAEQGFRVTLASDKRTLNAALESNDIKLIVLDVMLPDGSGLEICREMRAENSQVPIILLTALKEDVDRIIGLEIGADDYLGQAVQSPRTRGSHSRGPSPSKWRRPDCAFSPGIPFRGFQVTTGIAE